MYCFALSSLVVESMYLMLIVTTSSFVGQWFENDLIIQTPPIKVIIYNLNVSQ